MEVGSAEGDVKPPAEDKKDDGQHLSMPESEDSKTVGPQPEDEQRFKQTAEANAVGSEEPAAKRARQT